MKKITLLCFMFLATYAIQAQDTCAGAVAVTTGVTSVGTIDGSEVPQPICTLNGDVPIVDGPAGEWYSFTPTQDGIYVVTTNLPQNDGVINSDDTRVHIYSGSCGNLTCVGGNDDVDGTNFLSEAVFGATAGTTYYIAWDNRWSSDGFDFDLSLDPNLNCDVNFPYFQDWNQTDPSGDSGLKWQACWADENLGTGAGWTLNGANDFDGDGNDDFIINVFPQTTPPTQAPAKDAWAISPGINMNTNSEYEITIVYNGVDVNYTANESFELVILDAQTNTAANQTVIGSYSNITMAGTFAGPPNLFDAAYENTETFTPTSDGVYHLGIHINSPAGGDVFFVKEIEIEEQTLSVEDFDALNFDYFVDAQNNLNLSANQAFDKVELHNLLGQQVLSQKLSAQDESVSLNALTSGVYLAKVQINDATKTFKVVKK